MSYPGQRGDWSVNKGGLLYLKTSLEKGKIVAGIVVLKAGGKIIAAASILDVWPKVEGAFWFDYGDGEFTWVNSNFEPTNFPPSSSGGRYAVPDDDEKPL